MTRAGYLTLSVVATVSLLAPSVAGPGDITLASTTDSGEKGDLDSLDAALSANGTRVAFRSFATNLDPTDTDFPPDIYVKDLVTGEILLASTSDTGEKGNDGNFNPSLSANGNIVAFESYADNLDPADTDDFPDI
jgi:Tol biopolymer transport system component